MAGLWESLFLKNDYSKIGSGLASVLEGMSLGVGANDVPTQTKTNSLSQTPMPDTTNAAISKANTPNTNQNKNSYYVIGGITGKIHKSLNNKKQLENELESEKNNIQISKTVNEDEQEPSKAPELWESHSRIAELANFIVLTTRSIITYLFFWLLVFVIGFVVMRGDALTEYQVSIFNVILGNVLPSIIGYWFIRIPFGGMSNNIFNTIKQYIKK
jgi:hypothetical protein